MQITREDLPDRQVALTLEFEPQEIEPALQKTYQRLVGKVNIPGFRPGKAPRQLFERYVGREALIREASENLTAPAIAEAIKKEDLESAELIDVDVEETEPLRVRVLLDRGPLVELGDYGDLRAARDEVTVTEDEVEEVIRRLRAREAEWHTPAEPRPARMGDRVTVDLETFTIEGPVTQMTGTGQVLELSEHTGPAWPQAIDENLVGMQPGEEKDFAITFPEAYTDEDLRGKEATIHAKMTGLEEAELPELDDAFAQRAAQAETVDALRERVRDSLRSEAEDAARERQVRAVIDALKARSHVEVSHGLIDQEIDRRFERLTQELQRRHIAPARYFSYEGTTEGAWREAQHGPAREALEELLVLGELAQRESVVVTDADVEADITQLLAPYGESEQLEQLRALVDTEEQRERSRNRLFEKKLTDRIVEIAEGRAPAPTESTEGAEGAAAEGAEAEDTAGADATAEAAEGATAEGAEAARATPPDAAQAAEAPAEPDMVAVDAGGAVPATAQEPGPLETAGGAAEVLGTGEAVAEAPAGEPPPESEA